MAQLKMRSLLNAVRRSWSAIALALLWCIAGTSDAWAKPPAAYTLGRSAAEERIHKALRESTTIDFVEQPLSDVVQYLEDLHKIHIQLDGKTLEDGGASSDTPITHNLQNISLGSALTLFLADLDLDFIVTNDVLLITSKEAAKSTTELRLYNINDLITADRSAEAVGAMVEKMFCESANHHLLVSPVGEVLVIRDTQRGHRDIEALLETLRLALAGEVQPAASALSAPASNVPRAPENSSASKNSAEEPAAAEKADPFDQP